MLVFLSLHIYPHNLLPTLVMKTIVHALFVGINKYEGNVIIGGTQSSEKARPRPKAQITIPHSTLQIPYL